MQGDSAGMPNVDAAAYYARFALNGVGLILTEALYTAGPASRAYYGQPGLTNPEQAGHWRTICDAVHQHGGRLFAQLQHAGKLAEPGLHDRPLGPVDGVAAGLSWQTQRPNVPAHRATDEEIEQIVQGYGESARWAEEAGFDGIEIHGARGYLINDFLSAGNTRNDRWGDRPHLAEAVLQRVKAQCSLPVSFNYSQYKMDDYHHQMPGGPVALAALFQRLRHAGADILHLSARRILHPEPWGERLVDIAARSAPGPLLINGGIRTLQACEQALADTPADGVALARPFLANPDWLPRSLAGDVLRDYEPGMERRPLLA
ncbi:MAG: tRNA-dihydrouridine synthase [Pigmentiphaga sp.]|nr:tRNA-dihydrouridine synthase [Pigmentiphaga sp.]